MISPLLLPYMILDDCEYYNGSDYGYIYENDEVPDHDYHVEDRSLAGKVAGKR